MSVSVSTWFTEPYWNTAATLGAPTPVFIEWTQSWVFPLVDALFIGKNMTSTSTVCWIILNTLLVPKKCAIQRYLLSPLYL